MPDRIDDHLACDRHRAQVRRRYRLTISFKPRAQQAQREPEVHGKYRVNFRDGNETTALLHGRSRRRTLQEAKSIARHRQYCR
jgi:hypothetical protein